MAIDETNHSDQIEELPIQREQQGSENQHSLVCLSTFAPSAVLYQQYMYDQLSSLREDSQDLKRQVEHLGEIVRLRGQQYDQCVAALATCQNETARVLNHEIERHVLGPAVEAAVIIADELFRLRDELSRFPQSDESCNGLSKLKQEADVSCVITHEKLAGLGVERIAPSGQSDFDPQKHSVCAYVGTDDEKLHGRVSSLLSAGILYRGKVLRSARVSVFRYVSDKDQKSIERKQDEQAESHGQ